MTHEDYDLRQTTLELRFLVAAVTKTIGRAMQDRLAKSGYAITPVQLGLMRTILSGPQTISEASKLMMMDPSTLVPVVDALEARGMVERRKDPADRRRVPIHLTASGRQMLTSMMDLHDGDSLMEALAQMGPNDALQLRDLLRQLLHGLPEGKETIGCMQEHMLRLQPEPGATNPDSRS